MATSPIYSWPEPDNTDLVKNGALAIRTLGNAIDTTMGTMVAKTVVDAKGDLIVGTAADTVARLALGSNGQVLTVDTTTATGLKYATPSAGGGGKVLQVVQATFATETDNSTNVYADTGLTVNITPTLATSKVMVIVSLPIKKSAANANNSVYLKVLRGATSIVESAYQLSTQTAIENIGNFAYSFLDSPATTSATTYKVQFRNSQNAAAVRICESSTLASIIVLEIGA